MPKVCVQRCTTYELETLILKIERGFRDAGFDLAGLGGKRVALKPNLLRSLPPESGVITHPEVFRAVARVVKQYGGNPVLVESPAVESLQKVIRSTGYARVVDEEAVEVATDEVSTLHFQDGLVFKRFEILKAIEDVDVIINLPKFKTHDYTVLSGAVKNLFGVIPGLRKAKWHARANTPEIFPESIVDLYAALLLGLRPKKALLHVMDGILGMDGNGPGASGNARPVGVIIVADDALAMDCIQARIAGLRPEEVPITRKGIARGLGPKPDDVDLVGDSIEELELDDFEPPSSDISWAIRLEQTLLFSRFFRRHFLERPTVSDERCSGCFQCQEICASGAIQRADRTPRVCFERCIRCYCCVEICPEAAICLQRAPMQPLLDVIQRLSR